MTASIRSPFAVGVFLAGTISLSLAYWWFVVRTDSSIPTNKADDAPPDPRLTFETPFRNVKPDVAYVGDKACASCHSKIDKTYHQHPMGRSAAMANDSKPIERYDQANHNPFTALGHLECRVEKRGDRFLHHIAGKDKNGKTQAENDLEISIVIGSGTRGRSYLYVQDGHVWQSPVSWFSEKKIWDLSPGFRDEDKFQRPIQGECLFCHADQIRPIANTKNQFQQPIFQTQPNIGCERCHGPGALHVAERSNLDLAPGVDTSIVNPRHLVPELREAICQQCHLQGESRIARRGRDLFEYRPGLPFELFATVFVRPPGSIDYTKSVGQFEQLSISKCYISSQGKMGCISCHNPHETPSVDSKVDYYRGKCLSCHEDQGCKIPPIVRNVNVNNCIACHMPANPSASIAHASVSDHRLLRSPGHETPKNMSPKLDESILVPINQRSAMEDDPAELERDSGIALAKLAIDLPPRFRQEQQYFLAMAKEKLEVSIKKWSRDVPLLETMGQLLNAQGRHGEALTQFKKVLALDPDREKTLNVAVVAGTQEKDYAFAEECANKIVAMNPTSFTYRMNRAMLRISLKRWGDAEDDCWMGLRENSTHAPLRVLLAICLHRQGDKAGAQRELELALDMAADTSQKKYLRNLFLHHSRTR